MHFGAMTKCVDYAGVLIFKYPASIKGFNVHISAEWNDCVNGDNSWSKVGQ